MQADKVALLESLQATADHVAGLPEPPALWASITQALPAAAPSPLVVRRGATVLTTWTPAAGLVVTARLEALDDGRVGDTIRVRNRDSGRILGAQVSGQNQAIGQ